MGCDRYIKFIRNETSTQIDSIILT